jgi:large subunit ribosomal protein L25
MDQTVVTASPGRKLGTRSSRRLRAEGMLPGVVYGLGREPLTVTVAYTELRDALKTSAGMNAVIQLNVEGSSQETVIVKSVQRDPVRRVVTHADFLRIDLTELVKVKVPITLTGEPVEVLDEGGLIEQNLFEIEVEVSPTEIPEAIVADISAMTLDSRIAVGDLVFPTGATPTVAEDVAVVSPVISRAAKMDLDEEGEELLEGEEGAEGDDEGSEGGGDDASADASEGDDD